MSPERLEQLLKAVAEGRATVADAVADLRALPFEDVGIARVDHHRALRQGTPEVIFGAGKTPEQIATIAESLWNAGSNVLCTRASAAAFERVRARLPAANYHETARAITAEQTPPVRCGNAGIVCAGTSDLPVAEEARVACEHFGIETRAYTDVGVAGLHRLLDVRAALEEHDVLIVVAGMEGALPSALAGLVSRPVIATPTSVGYGASLGGLTALFAMLSSCAAGVSVVNIDNGFGAAAAARRILAPR